MEIRLAKVKLQVLHVMSELDEALKSLNAVVTLPLGFAGVILFCPVKKTLFNLGNLTHGKSR